jgi:hypothetical protein
LLPVRKQCFTRAWQNIAALSTRAARAAYLFHARVRTSSAERAYAVYLGTSTCSGASAADSTVTTISFFSTEQLLCLLEGTVTYGLRECCLSLRVQRSFYGRWLSRRAAANGELNADHNNVLARTFSAVRAAAASCGCRVRRIARLPRLAGAADGGRRTGITHEDLARTPFCFHSRHSLIKPLLDKAPCRTNRKICRLPSATRRRRVDIPAGWYAVNFCNGPGCCASVTGMATAAGHSC